MPGGVTGTTPQILCHIRGSGLHKAGPQWHDCAAVRVLGLTCISHRRQYEIGRWEHHASAARCTMRRGKTPHRASNPSSSALYRAPEGPQDERSSHQVGTNA